MFRSSNTRKLTVARSLTDLTPKLFRPGSAASRRKVLHSRLLAGPSHYGWLLFLFLCPGLLGAEELPPVQVAAASDGSAVASMDLSDPTKFPFSSTGKWKGYLDFLGKPGTERSLGQPDLFLPLLQDKNDMTFFNLRGQLQFDDTDVHEYNIGLGHRHMFSEWILGGYGYYDKRHTQLGNSYNQFTGGLELMSVDWAFRMNGYLPENKTETSATPNTNATVIRPGDQIKVQIDGFVQEKALPGLDGEVGYLLPIPWDDRYELRAYAGGYHFIGEDNFESVTGPRGRVEWRAYDLPILGPGSRFMMGVEAQWDEPRGSQAFGLASLRIPFDVFADKSKRKGLKGLDRRMLQPVIRDVDVVTSERDHTEITDALNKAGNAYTKVVEIDLTDPNTDTAEKVQAEIDRIKAELPDDTILFEYHGDGDPTKLDERGDGVERHYLNLDGADGFTVPNGDTFTSAGQNLTVGYRSQWLGAGTVGYNPNGTPVGFMKSGCSNPQNNHRLVEDSLLGIQPGGQANGFALDATGCGYGSLIQGNKDPGTRYLTNMYVMNSRKTGVLVSGLGVELIIADSTFTGNTFDADTSSLRSDLEDYDGALAARTGARIVADNLTIRDNHWRGVTSLGGTGPSYIKITNSTVTNSTVLGSFHNGLTADNNGELYAENLEVKGFKNGVFVRGNKSTLTIIDSTVSGNQDYGLHIEDGIKSTLIAENLEIYGNQIAGVGAESSTNEVKPEEKNVVRISHSRIYENGAGLYVDFTGHVDISHSQIFDNTAGDGYGIRVRREGTVVADYVDDYREYRRRRGYPGWQQTHHHE